MSQPDERLLNWRDKLPQPSDVFKQISEAGHMSPEQLATFQESLEKIDKLPWLPSNDCYRDDPSSDPKQGF